VSLLSKFFNLADASRTNKRLLSRSVLFAFITILMFGLLEYLVENSKYDKLSILLQFPEFLTMTKAGAIMSSLELFVLWVRIIGQPQVDVQKAEEIARQSPMSAAIVYLTHSLVWAFRLYLFLLLADLLPHAMAVVSSASAAG